MRLGSRVKVGGWICAISLPERWYGCINVGFGPNFTIFCYQIDLGSNHTHQSKINGGENLPLKDLVRGPVCWAKMVHFWKPWEHAFWPSPECWEPFSMLPRHALSSFMVWNTGVGPWWAATAEIFKGYGFKFHCLPTPIEHAKLLFTRQTSNVFSVTLWEAVPKHATDNSYKL